MIKNDATDQTSAPTTGPADVARIAVIPNAGGDTERQCRRVRTNRELAEKMKTICTIPNILSLARLLICLPVLWLVAVYGQPVWLGVLLLVALFTDALDGSLARRLQQVTALGSRLDSIADSGLLGSAVVWLFMLRPEIVHGWHAVVFTVSVALWAVAIVIGWVRFRRFANLHLYSGKAAAVVVGLFLVDSFLLEFHPWVFYLTAGVCAVTNVEAIVLLSTRKHVDEHIGSILGRAGKMKALFAVTPR